MVKAYNYYKNHGPRTYFLFDTGDHMYMAHSHLQIGLDIPNNLIIESNNS